MDQQEIRVKLESVMPYKWRVQSAKWGKATCVAYVDARDVMNRLDDVFGVFGWSDDYTEHKGNLFCTITIATQIDGEYVSRTDCGTESNVEKQKGEASDAFKRAAVKFGVGRFLYDLKIVTFKTAKHTNDKEYPADDNGNIIWDVNKHIQSMSRTPKAKTLIVKPTLDKNTNEFERALKWINEDGGTIEKIKTKYAVSKEVEELLTKTI